MCSLSVRSEEKDYKSVAKTCPLIDTFSLEQHGNMATYPIEYASFRITIPHSEIPKMLELVFKEVPWYICYPHLGKNGDNPHCHVFVDKFDKSFRERLRQRITRHFGTGNPVFSIKCFKNGLARAIQYGSKEGSDPVSHGEQCEQWIAEAPVWIPGAVNKQRKRKVRVYEDSDGEYELGLIVNKYNFIQIAARWYKRKKGEIAEPLWRNTIRSMMRSGKFDWQFSERLDEYQEIWFNLAINPETSEEAVSALIGMDFKNPNSI